MFTHTFKILVGISTISALYAAQQIKEITSMNEFQDMINNKKDTCIIFYAPWCQACNSMKGTFNAGAEKYKGLVDFVKVDASNEKLKEAADMFGIHAIPTVFYKHVGYQDKDRFLQTLNSFVGKEPTIQTRKAAQGKKMAVAKKIANTGRFLAKRAPLKKIAIPRSRKV